METLYRAFLSTLFLAYVPTQPIPISTPDISNRVHLRGLPFNATGADIEAFFAPLKPADIHLGYYENGRSTGDGRFLIQTFNF